MNEDAVERLVFLDQFAGVSRAALLAVGRRLFLVDGALERRSQPRQPTRVNDIRQYDITKPIQGFLLRRRERRFGAATLFDDIFDSQFVHSAMSSTPQKISS